MKLNHHKSQYMNRSACIHMANSQNITSRGKQTAEGYVWYHRRTCVKTFHSISAVHTQRCVPCATHVCRKEEEDTRFWRLSGKNQR